MTPQQLTFTILQPFLPLASAIWFGLQSNTIIGRCLELTSPFYKRGK